MLALDIPAAPYNPNKQISRPSNIGPTVSWGASKGSKSTNNIGRQLYKLYTHRNFVIACYDSY